METADAPLFDSSDLILLSVIGLTTIAWFSRDKIKGLLSSNKKKLTPPVTVVTRETNFVKVMKQQGRRVIIFYGSQTGTAEGYATRIAKECHQRFGIHCMVADLELYDLTYLDQVPKDHLVIFVMATYGEGDPTDNAIEFWDLLTEEGNSFSEESNLCNLNYVVFGLGNKTYEHYNKVAREVHSRLQQLGARLIGTMGEGDDDGSLEEDYLSWKEELFPAVGQFLGVDETTGLSGPREPSFIVEELIEYEKDQVYFGELAEKPAANAKVAYDAKRPFVAPMTIREIFQETKDRHCMHVEVDISQSGLKYNTGDHLAIWPTNNEIEVNRLAQVLGLTDKLDTVVSVTAADPTAAKKHPFPNPTTYRAIFRHYLEIQAPISRQVLNSFAVYASNPQAQHYLLSLATDKALYKAHITDTSRNLGQVLESASGDFSTVPFDLVIEALARLQPRFYSISSSAKENPQLISATIVTLTYPTSAGTVYGVNTNFLHRIQIQHEPQDDHPPCDLAGPRQQNLIDGVCQKIPIHIRPSSFKLPRNPSVPIVMVGPGTGVAPFRGFVRERALAKTSGQTVGTTLLFYGSRNQHVDYLYADEWPGLFETLGGDSKIVTAFSRDQVEKIYVQNRIKEYGKIVWDVLHRGGYIYVCGDARHMARDVNQTLIQLAITYGGHTEEKAIQYIKSLRTIGRYQEDVWS